MFIPEDKITEIQNTADIVEIISEAVLLKQNGKNYLGLCPFHTEKTPSFTVSPDKQIFYCFGCGVGGNIFSFLMKREGASFPETVRKLADRYGIVLPTPNLSSAQKKQITEREALQNINRQAMAFFEQALHLAATGRKALEYLQQRGIKREIIDAFHLGFAPDGWDHLARFFAQKKVSPQWVEKAGLIVPRKEKSGYYDRFRNRIIFPIFDHSATVVGFGGRVMDDARPKYLNSPETPLYSKSRSLYGLLRAREACRTRRTAFIVEGYFDLLALHQHGIENAVATLGTSLTPEHVQILKGFVGKNGKVMLVYDSDAAGIKAAHRSIEVFEKSFVDANILILPEGHDPDSFLFDFGRAAFEQRAASALGVIPFLIETAVQTHGLTVEGKVRIIAELKTPIAALEDAVARTLYVKALAERIDVPEAAVLEKVRQSSSDPANGWRYRPVVTGGPPHSEPAGAMGGNAGPAIRSSPRSSRIERRIIAMMLQFPEILSEIANRKVLDSFEDPTLKSIGQCILDNRSCAGSPVADLTRGIAAGGQRELMALLAIEEDCWDREGCLKLLAQFEISRSRFRGDLLNRIKAAEAANDHNLLQELLQQKQIEAQKRVSRCR